MSLPVHTCRNLDMGMLSVNVQQLAPCELWSQFWNHPRPASHGGLYHELPEGVLQVKPTGNALISST